ncbi:MAG: branched chain amino acid aminotransferase, partial [Candidatus Dormibacteria bacterium]
MTVTSNFAVDTATRVSTPDQRAAILAAPGFGQSFSDHMVTIDWTRERGWHDGTLRAYGPLSLEP